MSAFLKTAFLPNPSHLAVLLLAVAWIPSSSAQHRHAADRTIQFPDVSGFLTLNCDLHIHSVFSDGAVWPSIRVEEAVRDGLDCISNTEHLEYQPHRADIPHPDRNRSYVIATDAAKGTDVMVINGSEITRSMPPGHSNAVFVTDANELLQDDAVEAFRAAKRQGAFTFWNHPNWISQRKDGIATLTDLHRLLIAEGLLDGIEVVNETTYSDEALAIALENDLTILGTSDIHGLVDWQFDVPSGGHRPVTLVFAAERSPEGIKEALFARRTAVWYRSLLIGRDEHVMPLVNAALIVESAKYGGDSQVLDVVLTNTSDAPFMLLNESAYTFHEDADLVVVEPHSSTVLQVKTISRLPELELAFEVLNVVTGPGLHGRVVFRINPAN